MHRDIPYDLQRRLIAYEVTQEIASKDIRLHYTDAPSPGDGIACQTARNGLDRRVRHSSAIRGTRMASTQVGGSGGSAPISTAMSRADDGASGHGVKPSVSTITTPGRSGKASAAWIPTRMSVPPPPASVTCCA